MPSRPRGPGAELAKRELRLTCRAERRDCERMIIPIGSDGLPTSAPELQEQIEGGLRGLGIEPRSVSVASKAWPEIDRLAVDVGGAVVPDATKLPRSAT